MWSPRFTTCLLMRLCYGTAEPRLQHCFHSSFAVIIRMLERKWPHVCSSSLHHRNHCFGCGSVTSSHYYNVDIAIADVYTLDVPRSEHAAIRRQWTAARFAVGTAEYLSDEAACCCLRYTFEARRSDSRSRLRFQ